MISFSISFPICDSIKSMVIIVTLVWNTIHWVNQHKKLIKILLVFLKTNVRSKNQMFLLTRFVDLLRVSSLHIYSRNHSSTFCLINSQKTKTAGIIEARAICPDVVMPPSTGFCPLLKGALSGLRQFLGPESPLKMMKNVFYFTLKACFVLLKLFKSLS